MEKEKEQEIRKLINVLRRTARLAAQVSWGLAREAQSQEPTAKYCAQQYNRIFERLKELDPSVGTVFGPLEEDAPFEVVSIACRQLVAYYEEEFEETDRKEGRRRHRHRDWGSFYETAYEAGPFKILFGRGFKDIEELGKIIRECMPSWVCEEEDVKTECQESKSGTDTQAEAPSNA